MEAQGRLIVDIARLDKGGERYRGELPVEILELDDSEILTPIGGPVYDLFVQLLGHELLIRGGLKQHLKCVCVRCATEFETEAKEEAFTTCVEIPGGMDFLDLTGEAREAIILALPGYPVCREDCNGLCATCGVNLNETACTCREAERENQWATLDALM
ncbi:MAG: DUF177 domain-containing protein [Kiritimatiellaeota bacterium]|nr:DUF177 domain-containing protein [Kiritimatiellota bacterium]